MTTALSVTRQVLAANAIKTTIPHHILQGNFQDLSPISDVDNGLLVGRMTRAHSRQAAAATAAGDYPTNAVADHPGKIRKVLISSVALAAATETMTFDLKLNGSSVFSSLPIFEHTTSPIGVYDVTDLVTAAALAAGVASGDVWTVDRTLANGSTLTTTEVMVDWG